MTTAPRPELRHFLAAGAIIAAVLTFAVLGVSWLLGPHDSETTVRLLPVNQWGLTIRHGPDFAVTARVVRTTTFVGPFEIVTHYR